MPAPTELLFAPLGGVGEIGMNLALYGLGEGQRRTWMAVDLGVSFAGEELPFAMEVAGRSGERRVNEGGGSSLAQTRRCRSWRLVPSKGARPVTR